MVLTPWGNSEELREQRLRPGPGVAREEVVKNQRTRFFGAMVASVYERGYTATTVNDLVEISGVSSRTFYDLFPDKAACFMATLGAIIEAAVAYAAQSVGEEVGASPGGVTLPEGPELAESWEERAREGFDAFAQMVVAQPAAARLALVEVYAVGPEAVTPIEGAVAGFEWLTRQTLEQSPERADMPAEMVTALMGSQQEITRNRLWSGRVEEMPALTDELWDLVLSYRPPPEPLRLSGRPLKPIPETIDAHDHAERALRALAAVVAEEGYAETTVDAVLKRAQMSATTFYAYFHGKEDAMLAAIDSAGAQLGAAIMPPYRRAPDWPNGVRAAIGALCSFLASRPALANLMTVGAYAAGPEAIQRRAEALGPLQQLIGGGYELEPKAPRVAPEAIAGGIYTLLYRHLREAGPDSLPSLAPICSYIALAPFIGAEQACIAANGDGRSRGKQSVELPPIDEISTEPIEAEVMTVLTRHPASVVELAAEVSRSRASVAAAVEALHRMGIIEPAEEQSESGPHPHPRYRATYSYVPELEWEQMSQEVRERMSSVIVNWGIADVKWAAKMNSLDARIDRHLGIAYLRLDEQGWRKAFELHKDAMVRVMQLNEEAGERLKESGEEGIDARSLIFFFEMPDLEG